MATIFCYASCGYAVPVLGLPVGLGFGADVHPYLPMILKLKRSEIYHIRLQQNKETTNEISNALELNRFVSFVYFCIYNLIQHTYYYYN